MLGSFLSVPPLYLDGRIFGFGIANDLGQRGNTTR